LSVAARPADEDHPYGHGRFEILTGLIIGMVLTGGGALICYFALRQIGQHRPPLAPFVIWPLVLSIAAKTSLSTLKFRVGRRIGSAALTADAWNDGMDTLSALAALVAVWLTLSDPVRFAEADLYGGSAVGLIIVFAGIRVSRETSLQLMDTMPGEDK